MSPSEKGYFVEPATDSKHGMFDMGQETTIKKLDGQSHLRHAQSKDYGSNGLGDEQFGGYSLDARQHQH